ncbi:hypothetical protein Q5P01_020357 [Channa striata]|uniref:Uncharacterized protein n=1 Tax=Channa striata TaxID=64152 RepID=A0AA88LXH7_CHASR|nr:hypothetical protein Q5P01_020357 [Channa striata]
MNGSGSILKQRHRGGKDKSQSCPPESSLWTFLPGWNNGGPRSPASPQAPARGGRGLGTEGAAQHAEIWRGQISGATVSAESHSDAAT